MQRVTSFLVFLSLLCLAGLVQAADLQTAKSEGLVGERADGYLGLVKPAVPADVAELVRTVNAKRRAEYERIAAKNNLTLEQVQALAGKKAIERTEPGGWIMPDGGWQQKP